VIRKGSREKALGTSDDGDVFFVESVLTNLFAVVRETRTTAEHDSIFNIECSILNTHLSSTAMKMEHLKLIIEN
jgi:hypothetical protein